MLKISLPAEADGSIFDRNDIPKPLNGTDIEVNGDVILLFDDEEQAVSYLDTLEDFATATDNDAGKNAINLIVSAISNDEFVQAYLQ
ncbi:hypothetical protein DYU05_02260 [Mucilaginibacter terrenus]|uniref:Uncharacterized protein n=1 Tax=Mucilaginibacter terrenus TaxID=2482727 RepID=A0A3E2NTX1_9SPHI|nr:hypothetical protein [Mucilaginibacter terrenus]RFZ84463.1 hypothetical protein DYU05_02260 [Mucilaginibacter terrenus]